jgi:hypothetical protein
MSDNTYFNFPRQLHQDPVYMNLSLECARVFEILMGRASYKNETINDHGKHINLEIGEICASFEEIAKWCGKNYNKRNVRRYLDILEKNKFLARLKRNHTYVYRITYKLFYQHRKPPLFITSEKQNGTFLGTFSTEVNDEKVAPFPAPGRHLFDEKSGTFSGTKSGTFFTEEKPSESGTFSGTISGTVYNEKVAPNNDNNDIVSNVKELIVIKKRQDDNTLRDRTFDLSSFIDFDLYRFPDGSKLSKKTANIFRKRIRTNSDDADRIVRNIYYVEEMHKQKKENGGEPIRGFEKYLQKCINQDLAAQADMSWQNELYAILCMEIYNLKNIQIAKQHVILKYNNLTQVIPKSLPSEEFGHLLREHLYAMGIKFCEKL